ncbi:MAG: S8 family peptidase [Anaerolineales bacterium]|nr:S8 family peptidase [Anaerolineales bacterium]
MRHNKILFVLIALLLALVTVQPGMAREYGPAVILGTDSPGVIRDRYIVVFADTASNADVDHAIEQARHQGAEVHYRYEAAFMGFAATLPEPAVQGLQHNPHILFIEADQVVTLDGDQVTPPSWGLDRIDQRALPLNNHYVYNYTGAGVNAYIIDTGILPTHVDFSGRASVAFDAVGDGQNGIDCNGHGTHVAGTVGGESYGVAKDVTLYAVRVLNCSGSGTTSGVIAGVDWVTAHHIAPAVANMSLGGTASDAIDLAVSNSINSGVLYSVSAGNSRRDACRFSPARVPAALTIGATTNTDTRASYSNYGTCVDLFAPGSGITSAWIGSTTATNTISGTSMASPHVTGVAALYLQAHPTASVAEVSSAIKTNATANVVIDPRGSPNLLLYSLLP